MDKKRGNILAISLISLAVIIAIILSIVFLTPAPEQEKTYALNQQEQDQLNLLIAEAKTDAYPECKAFAKRDIELCQKAESEEDKNDCINYISYVRSALKKDSSLCRNVVTSQEKEFCNIFSQSYIDDSYDCQEIPRPFDALCLSLQNMDTSSCASIVDPVTRDYCYSEMGLIIAIIKESAEECSKIPQEWIKNYCLAWINQDIDACLNDRQIIDEDQIRKQLATQSDNENICFTINKTKTKELCFVDVAHDGIPEICDYIKTKDLKQACTAKVNNDYKACDKVQDPIARESCQTLEPDHAKDI
jgi:hypothetical protein